MNAAAMTAAPARVAGRNARALTARDLAVAQAHRVTNALYASRGLRADGLCWYWQFVRPARIREWIALEADEWRLQLALDGDAVGLGAHALDWRNFSGETRLLAWTACHEPLIALACRVFQADWVPREMISGDAVANPESACAGFTVHRDDGLPVARGVVRLAPGCPEPAAVASGAPRIEQPLLGVRAQLPLVLDELDVSPAELGALARGAIVRLDNRTLASGTGRVAIRAGHAWLIADVSGVRASVVAIAAKSRVTHHCEGTPMTNESAPTPAVTADSPRPAPDAHRGVAIGALPVRLTFIAGQVSLPFGAVSDVGAGFVFELGRRLDDQVISIHANDVPIATGELVVVGDLVGVRITRMLPRQ